MTFIGDKKLSLFVIFYVCLSQFTQAQEITLKFQPQVGHKQTMRMTAEQAVTQNAGPQQQAMEHSKTVTLDTEVVKIDSDGTVTLQIEYRAIQEKSGMKGEAAMGEYDSTQPNQENNPLHPFYSPMIAQPFTVTVSSQGRLLDLDLSNLYESMAETVLSREDNDLRQRQGDRAQQTIDRLNQRYGSRDKRRQSIQEQLEQSPLTNEKTIKGVLSHLFVPLPTNPVELNDSWQGPLNMFAGMPLEPVQGTYTVKAVDKDRVTVEVKGERSKSDVPMIEERGNIKTTTRLGGNYTARIKIDPQTGRLLSREAEFQLSGETSMTGAPQANSQQPVTVSIQAKIRVEPVESN